MDWLRVSRCRRAAELYRDATAFGDWRALNSPATRHPRGRAVAEPASMPDCSKKPSETKPLETGPGAT